MSYLGNIPKIYDEGDNFEWDTEAPPSFYDDLSDPSNQTRIMKNKVEKSWVHLGDSVYNLSGKHENKLPPGYYTPELNNRTRTVDFKKKVIHTDDLMIPNDPTYKEILKEVNQFFKNGKKFKENGFMHSRGYMLHGPPGSGKTALIQLLIQEYTKEGYLVLDGSRPEFLIAAIEIIRLIEPIRPLLVIFEDIDALFEYYGEEEVINYLDGTTQTNHVLNIATTNYPEKLDRRIINRPRRFDRVVNIGMPSETVRRQYFHESHNIAKEELDKWVKLTKGFSFSAMSDVVISVKCFDYKLEHAVEKLKDLLFTKKDSNNYNNEFTESGKHVGF